MTGRICFDTWRKVETFDNVWDAITDTPAEAANNHCKETIVMNPRFFLVVALTSLSISAPSQAKTKQSPMGLALGNLLVGDYGSQGKVTAAFDPDGTVALTFPDGTTAQQTWIADANYFCMIAKPGADGKMGYRCERNLIAGKKLNQSWQQIDSQGQTATITIRPRPR